MSAELQLVDDERQATQEGGQVFVAHPALDGLTSIDTDGFGPIVLADQKERKLAAIMDFRKQTYRLVANVAILVEADKTK
jgi:hypothetical protein